MDPLATLLDPGTIARIGDLIRARAPSGAPSASSPGLAALARAAGTGGVEQGAATRTYTGGGAHEVKGDPSGKYWWDGQQGKWRVAGELPAGYVIKPVK